MSYTKEGAIQHEHSLNHAVEFFAKAGSLMKNRQQFYGDETSALELFKQVWYSGNNIVAMKLLFWLRDVRGGAGNRSGFEDCVKWLAEIEGGTEWVKSNVHLIPLHGRYKDLKVLFGTDVESTVADLWSDKIIEEDGLACKWADRNDKPLLKALRKKGKVKDIGAFRRLLALGRQNVVERKMCENEWNEIEYNKIPSVAMSRYTKAFAKHTPERFLAFKNALEKGETTVNAGALFPHDCVRTVMHGDSTIASEQFNSLPDFLEGTNQRIMSIVDTSGSMSIRVSGSVEAWHISTGLGLYCSDRLGKDNPFYRKFIQFESEGKLTDWKDKTFAECYAGSSSWNVGGIFNGAVGSTRIDRALNSILAHAEMFGATNEQMPTTLLIISDMQFHQGARNDVGPVEEAMQKWEKAGYTRPKIVYWNTAGNAGSPETALKNNVALVSGFSPSILKAVFAGEDMSPKGVMLKAIEKYEIVEPK